MIGLHGKRPSVGAGLMAVVESLVTAAAPTTREGGGQPIDSSYYYLADVCMVGQEGESRTRGRGCATLRHSGGILHPSLTCGWVVVSATRRGSVGAAALLDRLVETCLLTAPD